MIFCPPINPLRSTSHLAFPRPHHTPFILAPSVSESLIHQAKNDKKKENNDLGCVTGKPTGSAHARFTTISIPYRDRLDLVLATRLSSSLSTKLFSPSYKENRHQISLHLTPYSLHWLRSLDQDVIKKRGAGIKKKKNTGRHWSRRVPL